MFFLYFFLGVLPCILWLLFYLRKDVHPESNKKIIEIFFLGILITLPVLILEIFFSRFFPPQKILIKNFFLSLIYFIFCIGFIEELFKYLVVKFRVIRTSHFDEPIDLMLYLIIAALGFATVENLLAIFTTKKFEVVIIISFLRPITAVFLHTLAAALTGYFLALSLYKKKEFKYISFGLLLASFFHGLYNLSVVKLSESFSFFYFLLIISIISIMTILVFYFFSKVKKFPRGCKL